MILRVGRSGPLRGIGRVPGDKSISHRALLFAALADGPVEVRGLGSGEDNRRTATALRALGASVELGPDRARVKGGGFDALAEPPGPIDCGNSGTTLRLLAGLLAGRPFETVLAGDASLSRRPMARVAGPLERMGATVRGRADPARPGELFPPLAVRGGPLAGIRAELPVASAQLKSALVLAGLQARGATEILEPGRSRDHTERMLALMGAPVRATADPPGVLVDPAGWDRRLRATAISVPGDLSSAAFVLVAASIVPGSDVLVEDVGLNPTRTGVLDALRAMGADLRVEPRSSAAGEPRGRVRARASSLRGAAVEGALALRSIDEIPALAAAAAMADGTTTFADLAELRVKESDRIAALCRELARAGVSVEERPDGFRVQGLAGRAARGGRARPQRDHRIAMAAAVLGLCAADETLVPADDIATSFPTFAALLESLGAAISAEPAGARDGSAGGG